MLPKLTNQIGDRPEVKLHKFCNEEDVSAYGAFEYGAKIDIEITVLRKLGAIGTVLRICKDGYEYHDIQMTFEGSDNLCEVYSTTIDTSELCGEDGFGLFYYEFLFLRGNDTLFTDTHNNFDFTLSEKSGSKFSLLVYEKGFSTPKSFGQGVIYHIFVDRFFKGDHELPVREDAVLNPDWDGGIPQYAPNPGDPVSNNVFFGGNLWGVADKLDYLQSLGVTVIYLSPIFKAYSNHKYDTGDYLQIDEMFGGEEAFDNLIAKSRERGMKVILDGVFNHTGDDSIYFNRFKKYGEGGAYNCEESEYKKWYCFNSWPDNYESWWGIEILPKLNHCCPECRNFFVGKGGVIEKYIKKGIGGWRLDVADELSNVFLDGLRESAKRASNGEAIIIGEVWENAVNKIAYGNRRRYFSGSQLDSVMNYPLKNAIHALCLYGDAQALYNTLTELYSSYPRIVSDKLMNLVGTHDTERIMTVLGIDEDEEYGSNEELSLRRLSSESRRRGIKLQKIASTIQYTVFGIPSVYYGDEIGLEGYHDPFCRMPFPWSKLDLPEYAELLEHYRMLGQIRNTNEAFDGGDFSIMMHNENAIVYLRQKNDNKILVTVNMGEDYQYDLPDGIVCESFSDGKRYSESIRLGKESAEIFRIVNGI